MAHTFACPRAPCLKGLHENESAQVERPLGSSCISGCSAPICQVGVGSKLSGFLCELEHWCGNLPKMGLGARTGACLIPHLAADSSNDASQFGLVLSGITILFS